MVKTTVIIPSYNPDVKLSVFVDELIMSGFSDIVVIDDGSDYSVRMVETTFKYIENKSQCTLLHHEENMGKGVALKTGFEYCLNEREKDTIIVTADDDGHYSVSQIMECFKAYIENESVDNPVVIGSRDFRESDYAGRHRISNAVAGFVMKYFCGVNVKDIQTGLRIIPYKYLDSMIHMPGTGFEYEINMLVEMKYKKIPLIEHIISMEEFKTKTYANYNPVWDTLKLLGAMIKYAVSSLSATALDAIVFYIILLLLGSNEISMDKSVGIFIATVVARVISATYNCIVNKRAVFKSEAPMKGVIVKFYIFSMIRAVVSYAMVYAFSLTLGSYADSATVVVKLAVDLVLFFVGYEVQKRWIF